MDAKDFRKHLRKNQTNGEASFWEIVRAGRFKNLKFRRQHTIDRFTVDFYCAQFKWVIELDGSVHDNLGQSLYDDARTKILESRGCTVTRLDNDAVLHHPEVVTAYLEGIIKAFSTV